jgi:hypothetical protein
MGDMEFSPGDHVITLEGESASVIEHISETKVLVNVGVHKVNEVTGRTNAVLEQREYNTKDLRLWTDDDEPELD